VQVPRPQNAVASLVAAADVPGIPTGAPLEGLTAASQALINRMKAFPTQRIGGDTGRVDKAMKGGDADPLEGKTASGPDGQIIRRNGKWEKL